MLRSTDLLAPDVAAKAIPANNASQTSPARATNASGTFGGFLSLEWPKIARRDLAYQLLGYERHNRAAAEQALGLIGQGQLDLMLLVTPIACRSIGTTKASNIDGYANAAIVVIRLASFCKAARASGGSITCTGQSTRARK